MPKFTLDLTQNAVDNLQVIVDEENAQNGTALTMTAWLELQANERAIAADLNAALSDLQRQADKEAALAFEVAATAERDQLLAAL